MRQGAVSWASSPAVRRSMQGNKSSGTKPEMVLANELFRRSISLGIALPQMSARPIRDLRRTADFVFRHERVAVFVDGCYWHGCPEHYRVPKTNAGYWGPKIARNRERDDETNHLLEEAGWVVMRFWEHEDLAEAADRVEAALATSA